MRHWLEEQILHEVVKNPLKVVRLLVKLGWTMLHLLEEINEAGEENVAFIGGDFGGMDGKEKSQIVERTSGKSNSITWRWRTKV